MIQRKNERVINFFNIFRKMNSILQCNKMSKKKSIQIKTMDVAEMISIKTNLSKPSKMATNEQSPYKISIRHKTQNTAKLCNMLKLARRQEIIKYKIDHQLQQAQTSHVRPTNQKDSLKQFPKREKPIKNSNPYRYFLSSKSERLQTEDKIVNQPVLHFNLTNIFKERFAIRMKCNSIGSRATTQVDISGGNRKNFSRKNCASLKKLDQNINETLQPWLMTQFQQINNHPMPYSIPL